MSEHNRLLMSEDTIAFEVCRNVVNIFGVILSMAMVFCGSLLFSSCPNLPMFPVSMIIQGVLTITLPVLYFLKFKVTFKALLPDVPFYTIFVTDVILCIGWLMAYTNWLAKADCRDVYLYSTGLGFCVLLWIFVGVSSVGLVIYCCCRRICRDLE